MSVRRLAPALVAGCAVALACRPALAVSGFSHEPAGQAAPPTQIGDVTITGLKSYKFKADLSEATLIGPHTLITVPDEQSHSTLQLHADVITGRSKGKVLFDRIDLSGHVRYSIIQHTPSGDRVLQGTAGAGHVDRARQRATLSGGVTAAITDAERLTGPATIRAGSLTVDFGASPNRYLASGDPASTDVRFTLRHALNSQPWRLHASGFSNGTFQVGRAAEFLGSNETVRMVDASGHRIIRVRARRFTATLAGTPASLQTATAEGAVRVTVRGLGAKWADTMSASCATAVYDATPERVLLTGSVRATFDDPAALSEPAQLAADSVSVGVRQPYEYEAGGAPSRTRIRLVPKPPPSGARGGQATSGQAGALGVITIAQFTSAVVRPGVDAQFSGTDTVLNDEIATRHDRATLHAGHITARLGNGATISSAEASGNVRYAFEHVDPVSGLRQAISGTAQRALYTTGTGADEARVEGPLRAIVTDPQTLAEPGVVTGAANDVVRIDLSRSVSELDVESPNETASVRFRPKQAPAPPGGGKSTATRPDSPTSPTHESR